MILFRLDCMDPRAAKKAFRFDSSKTPSERTLLHKSRPNGIYRLLCMRGEKSRQREKHAVYHRQVAGLGETALLDNGLQRPVCKSEVATGSGTTAVIFATNFVVDEAPAAAAIFLATGDAANLDNKKAMQRHNLVELVGSNSQRMY